MSKSLRYFFTLVILTASALSTQAQDCGCDHVINPPQDRATSLILDGETMGVKPGETVCLSAGFYMQIRFLRMSGEPGNPVVIKNCGGLVEIGDAVTFGRWYAIDLAFSNYVQLTGSGTPGVRYGIKLGKSGDSSLKIGASTDTEIDHLDIGNANFAGILAKTDYKGNVPPDAPEMNNVNIHDNYIHDTRGEGMYIGETTTPGQDFRHLEIWNNIVTRTGLDLLQVANAVEDVKVHHNVLYKSGLRNVLFQNKGLQIGDNCVGEYNNNFIIGSASNAMIVMGSGNLDIYNNYLQGAGDPGIFIDNRSVTLPGTPVNLRNNYLMEVRETVPFFNVFNEVNPVNITGNFVEGSNVVVGYGSGAGAKVTVSGTTVGPIERVQFTDVTIDDFSLPEGSPYEGMGLLEDVTGRNSRPFIAIIPSQKMEAETERVIPVKAGDHDGDVLTLEAFNLPSFVTFQDNGSGSGSFTLAPELQDIGAHHKVRVRVTDSNGGMNTQYYSITVLDPYAFIATASSSSTGNGPENTLDKNFTSRWEGTDAGQDWIQYDLREDKLITAVQVSFHNGSAVVYPFNVEVSTDKTTWTKVFSGVSSGTTTELENFSFPEVRARHLRISNAGSMLNSYNEVVINCRTAPIEHAYGPLADVYSDGRRTYDGANLNIKEWRFTSYARFTVSDLNIFRAPVISSRLKLRADATASGTLHIYLGENKDWTEKSSPADLPRVAESIIRVTNNFVAGHVYEFDLGSVIQDNGSYNFVMMAENTRGTLSFSSSEGTGAPELIVVTLRGANAQSAVAAETFSTLEATQKEATWMEAVTIYPNPVEDQITIGLKEKVEGLVAVEISDKAGKPVLQASWMNPQESMVIDLRNVNMYPGMYILKLTQEGFAPKTLRVFKR